MKKQIIKMTLAEYQKLPFSEMEKIPQKTKDAFEREQCFKNLWDCLNECLKDNKGLPVVYTRLTHVSRSGMSRRIRLYVSHPELGIEDITFWASRVMKESMDDRGIRVDGCGMDMGFDLVYRLSWAVYGKQENKDSGYSLKQKWL